MTGRPQRLGVMGAWGDPALQLLEDAYPEADLIQITDPIADAGGVDHLILCTQDLALAHFEALLRAGLPCTLLLRRPRAAADQLVFQRGLDWLAAALGPRLPTGWRLAALSAAAAEEISGLMGHPVTPLPGLPKISADRPVLPLDRRKEMQTFAFGTGSGPRETRRTRIDQYNWVRLRRLAVLHAADAQDRDLSDLVAYANGTAAAGPAARPASPPCVISVVPNGVGLGHVTRMMAVGKALQRECGARVIFWSFSRAAEIIRAAGFEVFLRQTAAHLDAHPPDWRQWETLEFAAALRQFRPGAITYDGATFDPFMIDALNQPGCGRCGVAWIRRGMLQRGSDAQLLEAEEYCDLVLEPGDVAISCDAGPTRTREAQFKGFSRYHYVPPVTLKPYLQSYDRRRAKRLLSLGMGRHCLVSLGGAFGNWEELRGLIEKHAAQQRVRLIWARSPLAPAPKGTSAQTDIRQLYPLGSYLAAFDGVISATGYNSFHELMLAYDGPVLLAPTNQDRLDDQVARASYAAERGWAELYRVDTPQPQEEIVARFMADVRRGARVAGRPDPQYGADEMARAIATLAARYR
ncbi:glycosyltransferase [Rhodobacter maris]|uniref:UDP:flavonoid glycosyltransferase YjiC (YdhE family) n=1 Tax=Rhodobacter maris TaxID=446682 RepID=A0A285SCV5_9RHOB|nr:hypothetical protein [Rhodobacter maris]SOC05597.1 UDP:flavonoid glycosyltransferase YjiC (YdhE family) [Rhodobacter maris]